MAPPKRPWFRFYVEALTDPKLRRLTPEQRWIWAAAVGAARMSPVAGVLMLSEDLPMVPADLAELAGVSARKAATALAAMHELGLVVESDGVWSVPAFAARQYESDSSTKRATKSRAKAPESTSMQRPIDVDEAPPETETETETEEDQHLAPPAATRKPDPIWEAMLDVCGLAGQEPTKSARGAWNRAAAELRGVRATPDEIRARAAAFRRRWPDVSLTPNALARRWAESIAEQEPPPPAVARPDEFDLDEHYGSEWSAPVVVS